MKIEKTLPPHIQKIIREHWKNLETEIEKELLVDLLEEFGGIKFPKTVESFQNQKF